MVLVPLSHHLSLFDVYYIHGLAMNLAYVAKICEYGYNVYFSLFEYFIQDRTSHKVIEIGRM